MYVYNEGDELTSETTGGTTTTYEYDPNGALTKSDDGTTTNGYTHDYDGYLTAFDTTGTANDATYTYDANKRRIAKRVDETTIKYFLDSADVIADYDGDDTLIATYVTPGLDQNLSQTRSGSTYYYMKDGLGSIRNLVDANEDTQNVYDYYAFGKELGTWTESLTNRYTYTAREWDEESRQYYYRSRYYSGTGGFLSRDSGRDGVNLYIYVSNRALILKDPSGWVECCDENVLVGFAMPGKAKVKTVDFSLWGVRLKGELWYHNWCCGKTTSARPDMAGTVKTNYELKNVELVTTVRRSLLDQSPMFNKIIERLTTTTDGLAEPVDFGVELSIGVTDVSALYDGCLGKVLRASGTLMATAGPYGEGHWGLKGSGLYLSYEASLKGGGTGTVTYRGAAIYVQGGYLFEGKAKYDWEYAGDKGPWSQAISSSRPFTDEYLLYKF